MGNAQPQTQTVVVTGTPSGRGAAEQPASVLSGDGLSLRRAGTLGETLDGLPGVSASAFGPNSSRPVIRGLDGDRVRLLDNGGASVDASSLSFDHGAASDPLVTERIEVLRGAAALLYGGNATGGVVNSLDNRIPRSPAAAPLSGRAELRLGGPSNAQAAAVLVEGGDGRDGGLAWHADAYGHAGGDQRVPRFSPLAAGQVLATTTRVRNSASQAGGGAVGAAWTSATSYLGGDVETLRSRYGTTVEPDVGIRMQRDRLALAGEWRSLPGFITQVSAQGSHSQYRHSEVDGSGAVGTTFLSRGEELRVLAHHAALVGLRGVLGVQAARLDFQALGQEAFVPATATRSAAVFVVEDLTLGALTLNGGVRVEQVQVDSAGDPAAGGDGRFGNASTRRYAPGSAMLGAHLGAPLGWQASFALGRTQRAPAYYELYANGLHVATAAYERGDPTLPAERSVHAELGLAWVQSRMSFKANAFDTRFSRYISLDATGAVQAVPGAAGLPGGQVPVYAFHGVGAQMRGFELEGAARWIDRPWALDLSAGLDAVRGDRLDSGAPLPRLAPLRLRLGLDVSGTGWRAGVGLRAAARQDRVPATDTATPGYALLDLWASGPLPLGEVSNWFVRLGNATNRLAYNAGTVETMRGLSPLPGRALTAGLRSRF
jgi:iron complex outermembrane receptor protein